MHVRMISDSAMIEGYIHGVEDPLMRQLVLNDHFSNYLKNNDVASYEIYMTLAENFITDDFLREPLTAAYHQIKKQLECAACMSDSIYDALKGTAVEPVIDSLLAASKGKAIYMDVWSVYCGPCRYEMSTSREKARELSGKGVVLAYLCVDSPEDKWKACKDTLTEGGWHVLLNKSQAIALKNAFGIVAVPFHILIDTSGAIREKGNFVKMEDAGRKL